MDRIIKCPICKKTVLYSVQNPHRPFCSEKCRLIDLGQWFEGDYCIPDDAQADDDYNQEH